MPIARLCFLYDRWVYKLSDQRVRATIRRDLFCLGAGHPPVRALRIARARYAMEMRANRVP
jgi:hypothetical protein